MEYYKLICFDKKITDTNFMLDIRDLNENKWLINYGIELNENKNYFDFILFSEKSLFFCQDCINPTSGIYIVSEKFRKIWMNFDTMNQLQWIPFRLFEKDGKEIDHNYRVVNFIEVVECVDWEKSEYYVFDEDKKDFGFYDLVIDKNKLTGSNGCIDSAKKIYISEKMKYYLEEHTLNSLVLKKW